jgi:predicted DNA-binding transcriptional regulator YafY
MSCSTTQRKVSKAAVAAGIAALANRPAAPNPAPQLLAGGTAPNRPISTENAETQAQRRKEAAGYVKQFHQAIRQKRQVSIRYRSPAGLRKYTLIPLDVKGGSSPANKRRRYMWGYFEKRRRPLCFHLEKVSGVEMRPETFDPVELAKTWQGKKVQFNLPRDWEQKKPVRSDKGGKRLKKDGHGATRRTSAPTRRV